MGNLRRPGCYNQPRPTEESGYFVLTRKYQPDGRYHLEDEWIPYRFTTACHHEGIYADCTGCEHKNKG
jgi:hypothetical protein